MIGSQRGAKQLFHLSRELVDFIEGSRRRFQIRREAADRRGAQLLSGTTGVRHARTD